MIRILNYSGKGILGCGLALGLFVPLHGASAASFSVLYTFQGGSDGVFPSASLIADTAGNLYGTTYGRGCNGGTVFELAPDGTETVLHAFQCGGSDGVNPSASLIRDTAGNLYGTTYAGGGNGCNDGNGCGTVFEVAPDGTETVLYAFQGGNDGGYLYGGVIDDFAGNLYGTTVADGADGYGVVYKLAPGGNETVLHAFKGGTDGAYSYASLLADFAGNLYGTTYGGVNGCTGGTGCGTVFKITPSGKETVLYAFEGGSDGANPIAGLVMDKKGNLYGTTQRGAYGGTVFKVAKRGAETILYAFKGGSDGYTPFAGLIMDKKGNLYGTTEAGGTDGNGTVFKLSPDGTETILHAFTGGADGANPVAGLIMDKKGNLYELQNMEVA